MRVVYVQLICFSKLAWRDALPLKREALCFASFCKISRRARYANPLWSQNIELSMQGSWTQGKNKPEVSLWIWWALQPANSLDCSSTQLNIGDSSYSQQADVGAISKYRSRLWRKKDSKKLPTKRTSEPTQSTNWSGNISAAFQVARYKVDCASTIFCWIRGLHFRRRCAIVPKTEIMLMAASPIQSVDTLKETLTPKPLGLVLFAFFKGWKESRLHRIRVLTG